MLKKILLTAVFLFSFQILFGIDTETRYFNADQTKAQVQNVLKEFQTAYANSKYKATLTNKISDDDYTINYSLFSGNAETKILMNYQFFTDHIVLSILDATFISASGKIIKLSPNHENEKVVSLYNLSKKQFIDDVFTYLKISENKTPSSLTENSVTKNYLSADNRESAKNFAKTYRETVLAKKYSIKYIGNPESNNYDVEYKVEDGLGYAIMVVNYDFRIKDFTITLKSANYVNKKTGASTVLSKNSTVEAVAKYYETTKKLLVTLHSEYIAPNLNK